MNLSLDDAAAFASLCALFFVIVVVFPWIGQQQHSDYLGRALSEHRTNTTTVERKE